MDLCDPWADTSDNESHGSQEIQPAHEDSSEEPEDTGPDPFTIDTVDPWPFLRSSPTLEASIPEPTRSPSEEVLAMAWGDLLAMSMAIGQVHDGNQAGVTTRASLLDAMEDAIDQFTIAFDTPLIKKWHWMLHLPDSLERHGLLPNCFASERKHKPIGALAANLQNQNHFEKHLLSQVVAKEISLLDQPNLFPEGIFLLKAKQASKKVLANLNLFLETPVDQALCSHFAQVRGATCSAGDVVSYHVGNHVHPPWQVAEIKLHFDFQGHAATLVNAWGLKEYLPSKQYAIRSVSTYLGITDLVQE